MEKILFDKEHYIELPESFEEVTFKQLMALGNCQGVDLEVVAIMTNVPKEKWQASNNVAVYYHCFNSLYKWVLTGISEMTISQINRLVFLTKKIELLDIAEQSVAQYEDLKILLSKFQKAHESNPTEAMKEYYPKMAAVYLYPMATGKPYHYGEAMGYVEEISDLPCTQVIGVVNFFLLKFAASTTGISNSAPNRNYSLRKPTQVLGNYLRRLAFRRFLTHWQREILKKKTILKN
jgi:hypothetical protein